MASFRGNNMPTGLNAIYKSYHALHLNERKNVNCRTWAPFAQSRQQSRQFSSSHSPIHILIIVCHFGICSGDWGAVNANFQLSSLCFGRFVHGLFDWVDHRSNTNQTTKKLNTKKTVDAATFGRHRIMVRSVAFVRIINAKWQLRALNEAAPKTTCAECTRRIFMSNQHLEKKLYYHLYTSPCLRRLGASIIHFFHSHSLTESGRNSNTAWLNGILIDCTQMWWPQWLRLAV